jgi:ribose-phosphate pyrophosphokinase
MSIVLLYTKTGYHLAKKIQDETHLETELMSTECKMFKNGEINTKPTGNIRRKTVYIITTGAGDSKWSLNDTVMEILILLDACKRADAGSITLVCPCFPYIRSDKKTSAREPIAAKVMANAIQPYINRLMVVDTHFSQFQGFFDIPVDNLYSVSLFCHHLKKYLGSTGEHRSQYILVSPDHGGAKRIENYAELLKMKHIIMNKKRDYTKVNTVICTELLGSENCTGKTGIIIDDIIDTAGTITCACDSLNQYGFKDYILVATHGILSEPALERIMERDYIKKVIITDSIYNDQSCPKIEVVTTSKLLNRCITEIETGGSISQLFPQTALFDSDGESDNELSFIN